MKQILVLMLFAVAASWIALVSITQSAASRLQPGENNVAIVRQLFAAFNAHDWKKMAGFYSDSCSFLDPAYGTNHVAKTYTDILAHHTGLEAWSPDVKDSITFISGVADNKVLVQFISSGTMAKEKIKWSLPICDVFTLENGKIIQDETYYNKE